jgi:outer membrane protein TolC
MSEPAPNNKDHEQKLVKLYMELTGACESEARAALMYAAQPDARNETTPQTSPPEPPPGEPDETGSNAGSGAGATALLLGLAFWWSAADGAFAAATNNADVLSRPLSLADAVDAALQQNPAVLKAQKDLEATQGISIQTRAISLPSLGVTGSYSAVQRTDIDTFPVNVLGVGIVTFGTPQNWSTQIKLVQSIYQGGRMLSAWRAADLLKQQSMLNYRTVLADTILSVEISYDDVLLAMQQISVREASVELLTRELTDTTRRFEAGTVPRFNVLRAEVELANARPPLIIARNRLRVSKNVLSNLMGVNLPRETLEDIPLVLTGKLEAEPLDMELPRAIALALAQRTELAALGKAQALRKEDLISAKAGYKPALQGFFGYDAHNSMFTSDLTTELHGWMGGAQASWNIFDGMRTRGRVMEARANYERSEVELDEAARRIELEVRTSYSNFIEAREVLESQKKVLEQAEEALRLAAARFDAGTGTQLDVLSAQTALTDARSTQAQALHDYSTARARLQRAIGANLPAQPR